MRANSGTVVTRRLHPRSGTPRDSPDAVCMGAGKTGLMDSSWFSSKVALAATLLAAALPIGCGGGNGSATLLSGSSSSSTTQRSQGPCGTDRAILFLEGAVCADGSAVPSAKTAGAGNSWSPTGETDAFVSANAKRLMVRDADGAQRTLFRAPKQVSLVHRPTWSPDGSQLAVLLLDEHGFGGGVVVGGESIPSYRASLAVIDVASGDVRRRVALSPRIVHMPYLMNPPDTLAFSPDGRSVLVSWESPAVVDLASGRVQRVWRTPSVGGWTRDGQVLFLDVVDRKRFGALRVWSPTAGQHVVWTAAQLRSRGIVAEHGIEYGQLRMSPDGSRLAIRTSGKHDTAVSLFTLVGSTPGKRIGSYPTDGLIWDFDWSPDGTRIAAVVVDGRTAGVRVLDPGKGAWSSVAEIPITIDGWDTLEAMAPIKKLSWNN
jgi:Tol biopolymer transport system component